MTILIPFRAVHVIISVPPWHHFAPVSEICSFWGSSCPCCNCSSSWPAKTNPAWGRVIPHGHGKQITTPMASTHPASSVAFLMKLSYEGCSARPLNTTGWSVSIKTKRTFSSCTRISTFRHGLSQWVSLEVRFLFPFRIWRSFQGSTCNFPLWYAILPINTCHTGGAPPLLTPLRWANMC